MRNALFVTLLSLAGTLNAAGTQATESRWWTHQAEGDYTLELYFFWTSTCPHCTAARPDIDALAEELPWVNVHSLPLSEHPEHAQRYIALASSLNERATSVPAFLFCGHMLTGYDNARGTGAQLRHELAACRDTLLQGGNPLAPQRQPPPAPTHLPLLGEVNLDQWSLPAVTVTLAALDSFNPCAFFVLLFLLSLLVNARSRARMLLIGGVFVGVSGIIYFLFMAAWLNLFLLLGGLFWITLAAGAVALVAGLINIKDFFWFRRGVSLSLSDDARGGLFKHMRTLVAADNLATMLTGTIVLAVLANAYELLCTAGFPMVFTRILTLNDLAQASYYAFLALYCLVYIIPLTVIVTLFTVTLGRRKLSEQEGRSLKLMSGLMMSGLGIILLVQPELLNDLSITLILLATVLILTALLHRITRTSA